MLNPEKLLKSFRHAFTGIVIAFSENQNLFVHALIATAVVSAGILLDFTQTDLIIVLVMIVLVFSAEMINTAIEEVVNDFEIQNIRTKLEETISLAKSGQVNLLSAKAAELKSAFVTVYLKRG